MRYRHHETPNLNVPSLIGTNYTYYKGALVQTVPATTNHYVNRGWWSQSDGCHDEVHPGPPYKTGGPLAVVHWSDPGCSPIAVGTYTAANGDWSYRYVGGFIPTWKWSQFGAAYSVAANHAATENPMAQSNCNAGAYGATGWNRFAPGNPTADLGIFLGEIQDVPRMLKGTANFFQKLWKSMGGTKGNVPKVLADQWLSTQFGWLPFISDLRRFHKTYVNLDRHISRIKRYNGRWQKRGGSILDSVDEVKLGGSITQSAHWPSLISWFYGSPAGTHTAISKTETRAWFEGSFRYWIPNIDTPEWRLRAVAELYGVFPNPALVWELTPFSWLADWVSNAGDVFANMDSGWADNLAAKYAYVMRSTTVTGELTSLSNLKRGPITSNWTFPIAWKSRAGASRFGFGLTESNFSARQWSILAALGIQMKH